MSRKVIPLVMMGFTALAMNAQANTQKAIISGSVINSASNGSEAKTNIASAVGREVGSGNQQTVTVNGSIVNKATDGGKASVNLGSSVNYGGTVNQTISVGDIVNTSSGGKSEINIGSVVKD